MSGTAITMMIVVCGVVWGGFAVLLTRAVSREGRKGSAGGGGVEGGADNAARTDR